MTFREIINSDKYATGYGTHKYIIEYTGDWEDMELITALDNRKYKNPSPEDLTISHYGGYVKNKVDLGNGIKRAYVGVYYD